MTVSFPPGPHTVVELTQLSYSVHGNIRRSATRALRSANPLGIITANSDLEFMLRRQPAVAAELDAAQATALAAEQRGEPSYRFPA